VRGGEGAVEHPGLEYEAKLLVCWLNILLLHTLCIKMCWNIPIPFPDKKAQNFKGRG